MRLIQKDRLQTVVIAGWLSLIVSQLRGVVVRAAGVAGAAQLLTPQTIRSLVKMAVEEGAVKEGLVSSNPKTSRLNELLLY